MKNDNLGQNSRVCPQDHSESIQEQIFEAEVGVTLKTQHVSRRGRLSVLGKFSEELCGRYHGTSFFSEIGRYYIILVEKKKQVGYTGIQTHTR